MGLFNFKKRKEMKNKLKLINNVTEVEKIVTEAKLFIVSNSLNKIIDLLDNPNIKLDNVQFIRINSELETIKKYPTKGYEELLKNKCSSIAAIIKRDKISLEVNDASNANEDRIYRILGEQIELTSQINALTGKMDNALGNDKSKPIKNSIDMLVNDSKAFPIKKNEGGKIVLTIQLRNDDRVVLIMNNTSTIYDEVFHSEGRYEFIISDNNVDVTKCESRGNIVDKNQRINNINKEIEDVIYSISDWDKI